MAGDGDSDRVRRARLRHRAHGVRSADAPRELGITQRFACRDLSERLPHTLLKRRATDVERQIEPYTRRFHQRHDLCHELLEFSIAADQLRAWKAVLQITSQRVR